MSATVCSCGHPESSHAIVFGAFKECRSTHNFYGNGKCNCREFVEAPEPPATTVLCATCDREIPESALDQHEGHHVIRPQQLVDGPVLR